MKADYEGKGFKCGGMGEDEVRVRIGWAPDDDTEMLILSASMPSFSMDAVRAQYQAIVDESAAVI